MSYFLLLFLTFLSLIMTGAPHLRVGGSNDFGTGISLRVSGVHAEVKPHDSLSLTGPEWF